MVHGQPHNGGGHLARVCTVKRDARLAISLLALVFASLLTATAWEIWSARQRTLHDVDTANGNLVQALNTYAEGVITQSAMLLLDIAERLQSDGAGAGQLQRVRVLVNQQQNLLSQLDALVVTDAQGRWLMSSRGPVPDGAQSSDRQFFLQHRDNPSSDIFIGPPIRSRSTGQWVLTISRRYMDSEGRFAGVAVVNLGIENFLRLFGKIDIGEQGAISLVTAGGQLLVRHPFREQDLGRDFSSSPNFLRHYAGATEGRAAFRSGIDGLQRIYAFRRSERYPIVTSVAQGQQEVLHQWHRQTQVIVAVVLAVMAVMAIIGWRLTAAMRQRTRAEQSLVQAREELIEANRRLETLAAQDPLTGLANRRRFDEVLQQEVLRAARDGSALSLLLIDLDYFKRYNDSYGHVQGDACLQAVGHVLQQMARRPGDLAARYGGEEMALILPGTTLEGALSQARRLLDDVQGLGAEHRASPFGQVTASVGAAVLDPATGTDAATQLVQAADRALYRAKEAGRNCVKS
ncbi:sensor domain-containing diguanylate cyclase [Delftia sp. PS-11]|uniref:GGDEF domain-containing protein n=1 Tax=Delftia sp. PS-11 TaxID=2767222 RepID=UPI002454AE6E|nr:sensor domain-containing diguanylate cyclase [Delftia sp. PS-11]KAJ8743370.1 GGDEF domain-containing protein [Delftia sp. PS-11]